MFYVRLVIATIGIVSLVSANDAWPQFRGPTGNGLTITTHPVEWSEQKNVAWKIKVEGFAWSQPIIVGKRIFVTTVTSNDQPKPVAGDLNPGFTFFSREGFSRAMKGGEPADIECTWKLLCLKLESGERLWEQAIHTGKPPLAIHRSNSYASETPVSDGRRIYVHVSMLGLWCFELDGNQVWQKELPNHVMQYGWGPGASPLLHADSLFIQCDNEKSSFLAAFDKTNGEQQWRAEREETSNWSTPWLWKHSKGTELVTCGGKKTISYNPETGEAVWELPAGGRSATTAVGNKDVVIVASVTKSQGQSRTMTCVKAGATGQLDRESPYVAWQLAKESPELSSPILLGDYLLTVRQQGGIVSCFDVPTGKRFYRERLPRAGGFTASPWAMGGKLFCLDEIGSTFVIEPAPELKLVATNKLDGQFRSSVAVADGRLVLRSVDHLFCIAADE